MQEFLIILKGDGMNHLSPAALQDLLADYKAWMAALGDQYLGGQRLEESGAFLTHADEDILTDGPFLESKEIIAGYFMIRAANLEAAIELVKKSPHLGLYRIEVRPLVFPKMK